MAGGYDNAKPAVVQLHAERGFYVGIAATIVASGLLGAVFARRVDISPRRGALVGIPVLGMIWYALLIITRLSALPGRPWRDHRDDFDLPFGVTMMLVPLLGAPTRTARPAPARTGETRT